MELLQPARSARVNCPGRIVWFAVTIALLHTGAGTARQTEAEPRSCTILPADEQICIGNTNYVADVCTAIAALAAFWRLPEGFFARLIWQESRFDPAALSPAGAQGIAQFMPGTARLRGLGNPFDPALALASSAEYLSFLEQKFGNLGLAAAAYNGGEGRLQRYLGNGGGSLPLETRTYVTIITGHPVDQWLSGAPSVDYTLVPDSDFHSACLDMAASTATPTLVANPANWQPWGVLVLQSGSNEAARAGFERVRGQHPALLGPEALMLITVRNPSFGNARRYSAMVGRDTRDEADRLCQKLLAAGGRCIVQKNRP